MRFVLAMLLVETLVTPVKTSRMFIHALSPNPRGGYNVIAQFMNYRTTGGREIERVDLEGGRYYVRYVDTAGRPDAEWVVLDLQRGKATIFDLPGFHAIAACRAENGRIFFAVDFGHILYYDPADEQVKMLGQLLPWKAYTNDRTFFRLQTGPDGMV